jgi:nicotinamidase-related amidase
MSRRLSIKPLVAAFAVFMTVGAAGYSNSASAAPTPSYTQAATANLRTLSRDDTVLLLVDHQIGLFTGVRDIPVAELKHNVVALAKAARALGIPVVVTATMPDGMWGPTIPELREALPGVPVISRTVINAWDDPNVQAAIKKTGRKQILIAGTSLEVCATLPALSAKADGYDARVVLDASGTFSEAKRTAGIERLARADIPLTDYATAAVEMLKDNSDPQAGAVYGALDIPFATLVGQLKAAKSGK